MKVLRWLWTVWLLILGITYVHANVSPAFAYGGRSDTTIGYDAGSIHSLNYDGRFVFSEKDEQVRSACARTIFGQFGKFLAAEGTARATQLEFNFAKDVTSFDVSYLYQKVGAAGEHLKFGVTDDLVGRYSAGQLNGGSLRVIAQGERSEMLGLERQLHETLPLGPEEGQLFYIQKQVQKGLLPPSQYPFPP